MTDPAELFNEALSAIETGRVAEAVSHLTAVLALAPDDREAAETLADLHLDAGDRARAEAVLASTSAAAPDDVELLVRRAELRLEADDPRGAAALVTSALVLRPSHAAALAILGDSFADVDAFAEATRAYRLSLETDPFSPVVWHNLAVAATAAGDLTTAADAWEGYLRAAPGATDADEARAELARLRAGPIG